MLPDPVFRFLRLSRAFAASSRKGPVRVYLLRGAEGTMLVAGASTFVDYFSGRFFSLAPRREVVAEAATRHPEATLERFQEQADLVVVSTDHVSAALFFHGDYLRLPTTIDALVSVPDDLRAFLRSDAALVSDVRRLNRGRFTWKVTAGEAELNRFYDRYYLPFVQLRHGALAVAADRDWLASYRSVILWTMRLGEPVAATLLRRRGAAMILVANGVLDGNPELVKMGAIAASYIQAVEYASMQGCRSCDFGGCRPSLHDGVLRYKRKWGITLRDRHDAYDYLVRWPAWTPAVAAFLAGASLIYRGNGGLSAVAALDCAGPATQGDADQAHHLLWCKGIERLTLIGGSGWQRDVTPPPHVTLSGPMEVSRLVAGASQAATGA